MSKVSADVIKHIMQNYPQTGEVRDYCENTIGHINDSFVVTCETAGISSRYFLQRIRREIFKNPPQLMDNIVGVSLHLRQKISERGGDPLRECMTVLLTEQGQAYYQDPEGEYWRLYLYIGDTICLQKAESLADFAEAGKAFGHFQNLLSDYPLQCLHETIPQFHHTGLRYKQFLAALEADSQDRAASAATEIRFAQSRYDIAQYMGQLWEEKLLPLRVTHNDTKLNNILFDRQSREAICVVDLDTIMPGLALSDFGDAIRFGASTAAEDEQDLSKVELSLELYEAFSKGFIGACGQNLSRAELEHLPFGAKALTYECGLRFLSDYLEGDHYFKTQRPQHNLERARTQFKLVREMEAKWEEMQNIVNKYIAKALEA